MNEVEPKVENKYRRRKRVCVSNIFGNGQTHKNMFLHFGFILFYFIYFHNVRFDLIVVVFKSLKTL